MRKCPICCEENPIEMTILDRVEYTKCRRCGLLYTHADVSLSSFNSYYDEGRDDGKNYQDDYIKNDSEHTRNINLAKQMQFISEESWTNKDILEIGSSAGYLLKGARELGARVRGLEISRAASDYANNELGIITICDNWERVVLQEHHWENHFDFILMAHVVEHFVFPVEAIGKIARAIRLGGAWITQHPDASVYPGVKFHVRDNVPKEHLQIFDEHTILEITEPLGLRRVTYNKEEPGQSVSVFRKIKDVQ